MRRRSPSSRKLQSCRTRVPRSSLLSGTSTQLQAEPGKPHKTLEKLQSESATGYVSPFYVALVYAGLKDENHTMEWLEKAYADRSNSMVFLDVDPRFYNLRSNPKFQNLLQRMNFVN
jgi:hypothetical protein